MVRVLEDHRVVGRSRFEFECTPCMRVMPSDEATDVPMHAHASALVRAVSDSLGTLVERVAEVLAAPVRAVMDLHRGLAGTSVGSESATCEHQPGTLRLPSRPGVRTGRGAPASVSPNCGNATFETQVGLSTRVSETVSADECVPETPQSHMGTPRSDRSESDSGEVSPILFHSAESQQAADARPESLPDPKPADCDSAAASGSAGRSTMQDIDVNEHRYPVALPVLRRIGDPAFKCGCGLPVRQYVVNKVGPNQGRIFLRCPRHEQQCGYFRWVCADSAVRDHWSHVSVGTRIESPAETAGTAPLFPVR